MPHIIVKCYAGKSEEQKTQLAEKLTAAISEVFACPKSAVSIGIEDVQPADWKQVWDADIAPNKGKLYKEPGYDLD